MNALMGLKTSFASSHSVHFATIFSSQGLVSWLLTARQFPCYSSHRRAHYLRIGMVSIEVPHPSSQGTKPIPLYLRTADSVSGLQHIPQAIPREQLSLPRWGFNLKVYLVEVHNVVSWRIVGRSHIHHLETRPMDWITRNSWNISNVYLIYTL